MTLSLLSPDITAFPSDYADARQRWQAGVSAVASSLQSYPCAGNGPAGEALFTDCAWIGPGDAAAVVVLIAGTHGVEGLVGSAVQLDLLGNLTTDDLGANTALLLVHALTPWGYAWLRRCDADGVDLNRNCVDFAQPLPQNFDFDRLRHVLFEVNAELRWQLFEDFARQHGRVALEQAISGGQYSDPLAPFFGGFAPAHGRLVCQELIERYQLRQRRLAVIDLHSGLGPYGYGEIICDHVPDSPGARTAQRWYGDAVTLPLAGTSHSVPKLGLLDYLWHEAMSDDSCYITLEFGSYSTERLFEVLLQDHLLWAQAGNENLRHQHAEQMRLHFCPNDPAWRQLVLFRGRQVIGQALQGICR